MRESFHGIWPIWKIAKKRESRDWDLCNSRILLAPILCTLYVVTNRIAAAMDHVGWDPQDGIR